MEAKRADPITARPFRLPNDLDKPKSLSPAARKRLVIGSLASSREYPASQPFVYLTLSDVDQAKVFESAQNSQLD